ncbi:hypothetical protein HL653_08205 [Sphingomonas sp. AP4-R1]|uniref:hypothetical protein n=1 Tax=Sphingomonas sp. AP4-R1 TaxID=2735134 RepID=UPI0014938E1A|nr:hypothetical protein [Sphingomonas sp. AP4-R1]QJU57772.1 hypothetical protein HL653_08205 [Sphingomonas sp. AP4-R1]
MAATIAVFLAGCGEVQAEPRAVNTWASRMTPAVSRCLIKREPDLIAAWLQTLPGTAEEAALVKRNEPRFSACFDPYAQAAGGWLEIYDAGAMRPALVRAMLQSRRKTLPRDLGASTDPQRWYQPSPDASRPDIANAIVVADLGLCLARKDWADVTALIHAVDPEVEGANFIAMQRRRNAAKTENLEVSKILPRFIPSMGGCVPEGIKLRLDQQRLRDIIDEAAYHLIVE